MGRKPKSADLPEKNNLTQDDVGGDKSAATSRDFVPLDDDALADGLKIPEVNPDAVAAMEAAEKQRSAQEQAAVVAPKKRGRPAGGKNKPRQSAPNSTLGGMPGGALPGGQVSSVPAAAALVNTEELVFNGLFGEEWIMQDAEKQANIEAIAKYFDSKGGVQISPVAEVLMMQAGYMLPRLTQPKTKTKFQLIKAWVADKWATWRGTKVKPIAKKEADNGAHADRGDNRERQDNVGNSVVDAISKAGL